MKKKIYKYLPIKNMVVCITIVVGLSFGSFLKSEVSTVSSNKHIVSRGLTSNNVLLIKPIFEESNFISKKIYVGVVKDYSKTIGAINIDDTTNYEQYINTLNQYIVMLNKLEWTNFSKGDVNGVIKGLYDFDALIDKGFVLEEEALINRNIDLKSEKGLNAIHENYGYYLQLLSELLKDINMNPKAESYLEEENQRIELISSSRQDIKKAYNTYNQGDYANVISTVGSIELDNNDTIYKNYQEGLMNQSIIRIMEEEDYIDNIDEYINDMAKVYGIKDVSIIKKAYYISKLEDIEQIVNDSRIVYEDKLIIQLISMSDTEEKNKKISDLIVKLFSKNKLTYSEIESIKLYAKEIEALDSEMLSKIDNNIITILSKGEITKESYIASLNFIEYLKNNNITTSAKDLIKNFEKQEVAKFTHLFDDNNFTEVNALYTAYIEELGKDNNMVKALSSQMKSQQENILEDLNEKLLTYDEDKYEEMKVFTENLVKSFPETKEFYKYFELFSLQPWQSLYINKVNSLGEPVEALALDVDQEYPILITKLDNEFTIYQYDNSKELKEILRTPASLLDGNVLNEDYGIGYMFYNNDENILMTNEKKSYPMVFGNSDSSDFYENKITVLNIAEHWMVEYIYRYDNINRINYGTFFGKRYEIPLFDVIKVNNTGRDEHDDTVEARYDELFEEAYVVSFHNSESFINSIKSY